MKLFFLMNVFSGYNKSLLWKNRSSTNYFFNNCHANFSSYKNRNRKAYDTTSSGSNSAMDVNTSLRSLYKSSHPDILRSTNTEYAQVNSDSMQILNGILSTVKKANSYPPATHKDIPFYVKIANNVNNDSSNSSEEIVQKHILCIRTAGGDCKKQLRISLEQFFISCGKASSTHIHTYMHTYIHTYVHTYVQYSTYILYKHYNVYKHV